MRRALGRGLSQLLAESDSGSKTSVALDLIEPNKRQPRHFFDEIALAELADSIRAHGILAPLLVRPLPHGRFELIAGERRLRAAQLAGLAEVPVVVRSAAGQDSLELAIVENVQRQDISAYDSALAFQMLSEEFGLNQEEIALKIGKSRTSVSNTIRLLKLPQLILNGLQIGKISEGHARALLAISGESNQLRAFTAILDRGLSVRDVERLGTAADVKKSKRGTRDVKDIYTKQLETAISERLSAPSTIKRESNGTGTITLQFANDDDFQRILEVLEVEL